MGNNPIDLKEQCPDMFSNNYDKYSGFNEGVENPIEEEHLPITEVVGIVRRGEESDFLHGRRNWVDQGCFSYIDLNYMTRFHRIWNLDGARAAYIERVVPSYEDGSE